MIIIMPSVAMTMRIGYSKRSKRAARANATDIAIASAEPISDRIFMKRANSSTTKAPWKVVP